MGRKGSDIYLFQRGDGIDKILEADPVDGVANPDGGRDVIAFGSDITPEDLVFEKDGDDLTLRIFDEDSGDLDNEIKIKDWGEFRPVELLTFSNGTILDIYRAKFHTFGNPDNPNTFNAPNEGIDRPWIVDGGIGADEINGAHGNDIIFGGKGDDTLRGDNGHDYLSGGGGDDILKGQNEDDTLIGGDGNDKLFGDAGDDLLDGGENGDELEGGGGNDILFGGKGHDTLKGEAGDDVLVGGSGDDLLKGGNGGDVYVVGRDEGKDAINDSGGVDTLVFGYDIDINDLSFDMSGGTKLQVGIGRQGDIVNPSGMDNRVSIENWDDEDKRIDTFVFANGLVMDVIDIDKGEKDGQNEDNNKSSILVGGDGDNKIIANGGDDVLIGGAGKDDLRGNAGNDSIFGGNGNDDNLNGGHGDDRIFGGQGNDRLEGESGYDFLAGGTGDDTLVGGDDSDTYFFTWGDGDDRIVEKVYDEPTGDDTLRNMLDALFPDGFPNPMPSGDMQQALAPSGNDSILFGSGIWLSDIVVTRSDGSLYVDLLTPDHQTVSTTIEIDNVDQMSNEFSNGPIETMSFSMGFSLDFFAIQMGRKGDGGDNNLSLDLEDGEVKGGWLYGHDGEDTLTGGVANDVLIGGRHDDTLRGGMGDDIYVIDYGDGRDTIVDGYGLADTLVLGPGIGQSNVAMSKDGDDLLIIIIENEEQQDLVRDPTNFDDFIRIKDWYALGMGRIEKLAFADGTAIDITFVSGEAFGDGDNDGDQTDLGDSDDWVTAGSGRDNIKGNKGNDHLFGGRGDDILKGGSGDDWLEGQSGDDELIGGLDSDTLVGGAGNDTLEGGEGTDALYGGDGDDIIKSDDYDAIVGTWTGVDATRGGSDLIVGGRGNDIIVRGGYSYNYKNEDAGTVDDPRTGSWIVFNAGDGQDTIRMGNNGSGKYDVIEINGYSHEQIWFDKVGDDLKIKFLGSEDKMVFEKVFDHGGENKFAAIVVGGQVLEFDEIQGLADKMNQYTPNDGTNGDGVTASSLPSSIADAIKNKWDNIGSNPPDAIVNYPGMSTWGVDLDG